MALKKKTKRVKAGDSVRAVARRSASRRPGKKLAAAQKSSTSAPKRPAKEPSGPPPSLPIPDLPETYGVDRITVLARDPWWLFAYWEIQPSSRKAAERKVKDPHARLALRIYEVNGDTFAPKNVARQEDVIVNDQSIGNWYVNVWNEGAVYVVEAGLLGREGKFAPIVRSNPLNGTLGTLSEEIDERWSTSNEAYQTMFQLREGEAASGPSSMDIQRLLRRKLETELSSGAAAGFSSSAYPAHVAEGEARAQEARQSSFWLQVATEVILYGATEPDADLTVMGQPVQLRKDGTFSLRFALPEGKHEMRVHARSASKEHERSITPVVERTTR